METINHVKSLIEGYLEDNCIELVDIVYRREQGGMVLRLLVDTPGGITIAECEALNNYLSRALDREEIITECFLLEVSSPGLDRPIVTDRDFAWVMGKELDIRMYDRIDGKKEHCGNLVGMNKENVVIGSCGISTVIPRVKIAKATLSF